MIQRYSKEVGEVAVAWNSFHFLLQCIFCALVERENMAPGVAIWNAIKADALQRDLLVALAKTRLTSNSRLFKNIIWVTAQATELAKFRNDAIHMPVETPEVSRDVVPWHIARPASMERVTKHGYKKLFRTLVGDLNQLYVYSVYLNEVLAGRGNELASLRRPLLRCSQLFQEKSRKSGPRRQKPRRRRQPNASP